MHAQVTTVEAFPAGLDDAIRFFREQVLERLRQMDGVEGFIALGDRRSGKLLGVALWENEGAVVVALRLLRVSRADDAPLWSAALGLRSSFL
jgi:hypothetical protein